MIYFANFIININASFYFMDPLIRFYLMFQPTPHLPAYSDFPFYLGSKSKEILAFGNTEIEYNKFYRRKTSISWDVDIEKVLVSSKISFGEKNYKHFIGYLYNDKSSHYI